MIKPARGLIILYFKDYCAHLQGPRYNFLFGGGGATGKSVGERREPTFLGDPVYSSFVISLSENEIDFGQSSHKSTF